ncbi:SGNH/GDSL hydrolase family protein [Cohnella sp. JJ-181]|uniref:SGNH/GDSL hydrolase family protein n=1 Tax=Cohnella rhizoplanae TaxID=2974897 RepID=UPI00232B1A21|nr:SGNH/GDSL hydrolase family protein [Cohnella sp. JJ-181]
MAAGKLTVGYIGGSITDGRPAHNWPEPVTRWLTANYPGVRIVVENAGIGATGSDLAAFRAKRDLIDRGCDLVFVEFAVNDNSTPTERRQKTREGLLRQLLSGDAMDVVLVYTYCQDMYGPMSEGRMPPSIAEFEALAEHYELSSVWMGLHAFNEVKAGLLRWEEWLPDGLHPTERGSYSYGSSVIGFLQAALAGSMDADDANGGGTRLTRPQPLDTGNWERVGFVPFDDVRTEGPWTVRRWVTLEWIDRALSTSAVGAKLYFKFEGRGLALAFDFGKLSAECRYRIDGGDWQATSRERPSWCGPQGWLKLETLADDLPQGSHEVELEVIHGDKPDCGGTRFDLAFIGILI